MLKERILQTVQTELANELSKFEIELNRILENDSLSTEDTVNEIKFILHQMTSRQHTISLFNSYFLKENKPDDESTKKEK